MIRSDPEKFRELVQESLKRHVAAINKVRPNQLIYILHIICPLLTGKSRAA